MAEAAARLIGRLIAHDLNEVGVTVDCAPVLDVAEPGTHAVIGARAWSEDPERVAALGRAFAEGLLAGGVAPVIKHMPGHGRARADSHHELPTVEASREALERDFAPFKALADLPMAMTAHVVFRAIDPDRPATASRMVVDEIMRGVIGFAGLLMSDDVSMKALSGPFEARAEAIFDAGLDIALHCNGDLEEARAVASVAPPLAGTSARRAEAALAAVRPPEPLDLDRARAGSRRDHDPARARLTALSRRRRGRRPARRLVRRPASLSQENSKILGGMISGSSPSWLNENVAHSFNPPPIRPKNLALCPPPPIRFPC